MKTILVDAYNTFVLPEVGINQEMYEMLDTYPNKKIIVTNANEEEMQRLGINNLPYEIYTLKHNPDKVDPLYFKSLLTNYNLTPNDVIYFEHNPEAVKSAQSEGITSYHYNHELKDLNALRDFLNSNL